MVVGATGAMGDHLSIRCLGSLRIRQNGEDSTPRRGFAPHVVAELVASRDKPVSAYELLERVWGELPTAEGTHKIHQFVSRLRQRYPGAVQTVSEAYRLNDELVDVDVWNFQDAFAEGDELRLVELVGQWDGDVLEGLDPTSPRVQSLCFELAAQRTRALELAAEGLSLEELGHHFDTFRRQLLIDPYSTAIAIAVAGVLQARGRISEGLEVVKSLRDCLLEDKGLSPPDRLVDTELALLQGRDVETAATSRWFKDQITQPDRVAEQVLHAAEVFVGRQVALSELESFVDHPESGIVLIEGSPGIGKSELILQLGKKLHGRGTTVRYGSGGGAREPFAMIAEALPEFVDIDLEDVDSGVSTIVAWRRLRAALGALCRGTETTVVLLDDLHDADSASLSFLRYLNEVGLPPRVSMVATARPCEGVRTDVWRKTRSALLRGGALSPLTMGPLDVEDVVALLTERFPEKSRSERVRAAIGIHRSTEGTPLDIATLLHGRSTLPTMDESFEAASSDRFVARAESALALRLLGLAGTIGVRFDAHRLAQLGENTMGEVLGVLQEAMRSDLIRELEDGSFRFVHAVAASGFSGKVPLVARQMAHARLAMDPELSAGDRTRHVRKAGPLLQPGDGYRVLIDAAEVLIDGHLYDEAAEAIKDAANRAVDEGQLADAQILAADVASHRGTFEEANAARAEALTHIDPDDHSRLKRLALSGLPDGESPFAEPDRRALLDQLNEAEMASVEFDALFHRMHVRVTWLCDDLPGARLLLQRLDERGRELGRGPYGDIELEYEAMIVDSMSPQRLVTPSQLEKQLENLQDPRLCAGVIYRQAWEALQSLAPGFDGLITEALVRSRKAGAGKTEYLCELLRATVAGSRISASEHQSQAAPRKAYVGLVEDAHRVGVQLGIRGIDEGYLAQTLQKHWFSGDLADIADLIAAHPLVGQDILATAGAALALSFKPEPDERLDQVVRSILEELRSQPDSTVSPDVACMVIEASWRSGRSFDLGPALLVLDDRAGEGLVGGLGTVYLGPVDRYRALALRARGEDEARVVTPLLECAAERMQETGMIYWEEQCRKLMRA